MKKILLSISLLITASLVYSQNILVADNNPGAPAGSHVYSTLQAAINAASAGDIIHVIPSATAYDGTTTVIVNQDSISIYGIGFFPDKDGPQIATIYQMFVNASGVRISGLRVTNSLDIGQDNGIHNGITIENSYLDYVLTGTGSLSNILLRSCIINRNNNSTSYAILFTTSVNNSVISNCIIEHYESPTLYEMVEAHNGTIIKNCIFFGSGGNQAFENLNNCTVSNSIFYGTIPTSVGSFSNNVFNNNVAMNSSGNFTLPPAGQAGSGNITAVTDSTLFAESNIEITDGSWNFNWDANVIDPDAIGAGTDGTDIGVMGGTIPWSRTGSPLPLIQKLIVPEVIRQGENLNATIQAQGN